MGLSGFSTSCPTRGGGGNAQIQPANMPDQYLAASGLATVNTALIECSPAVSNGFLSAIVWGNTTATNLYIRHTNGQSVIIPITNAVPSSKPNVILADDNANPGLDYIAVVCYQDNNGDIQLKNYRISNITGTMIATQIGAYNLGAGNTPKIDGFANNTSLIAGRPTMDQFVVVWNLTTVNDIGVYAADVNDITLSVYSNTFTNAGINPDVAAIRNIANNHLYAAVVCYNGSGGPADRVYDIDITTATTPVITAFGANGYPRPRIEGLGLYDPSTNTSKWGVVTINDYTSVRYYSNLYPTTYQLVFLSTPPPNHLPSSNNYTAAITAGIGPFTTNPSPIGNRQCTIAWGAGYTVNSGGSPGILSAAFDYYGHLITSPITCANVNNTTVGAVGQTIDEYEVGITSSCNSGNRLFSAWWNIATGAIYYKLTPNNQYQFRPTGINTEENKVVGFSIYPNPAKSIIQIKCKDLKIQDTRILNSLGQVEMKGLDAHSPINISSLPSGNYFISIQTKEGVFVTQPFVKD